MSIRIMSWVWDSGPADQAQTMVLLAIADFCDDSGMCWPSVASIAQKARMSERNARRIIRALQDAGWLDIEEQRGRNQTNRYRVKKPDIVSARTECPPGQMEHENRTNGARKPDTAMSAEPSRTIREPSETRAKKSEKDDDATATILSEVATEAVARNFVGHRREMKKPLTERAARAMAERLRQHGNPDAVLKLSIENGWQGVFPDKVKADAPMRRAPPGPDTWKPDALIPSQMFAPVVPPPKRRTA